MSDELKKLQDRVFKLVKEENWDELMTVCTDFISSSNNSEEKAWAYLYRGVAYSKKGEHDKEIEDYNKALELNPESAEAYINRGVAYGMRGEYDKEIEDYDKVIELNSEYTEVYNNRGIAYFEKGNYDEAIADYDKSIVLNPEYTDTYFNRGVAYGMQGEHDKAIEDFDKAIEFNPESADAYNKRGSAYFEKGDYDKAIEDFAKAIKLNSEYADAYINRGLAYGMRGEHGKEIENFDKAIEDFGKAIELNPKDTGAYFYRGIAYGKKEEHDKAIEDYDKAIELNPESAEAYINRGVAYGMRGEYDKEIEDYDKALELNPKHAGAYLWRGIAYGKKGEHDKAIEDFDKAIEFNPESAEAYRNRGVAYLIKKESDRAIKNLTKAIEFNPESVDTYYKRGYAYYEQGNYDGAIKDYKVAIDLDPKSGTAYFNLGLAYYQNGDYKKAFDDWVKAGKYEKSLQSELPGVYIASCLNHIFNNRVPPELKSAYLELLKSVAQIKGILFYENSEGKVAHYTSLDVLKHLADTDADNHSFRLYNAAYMNDPEEGRFFFEVMNDREVMEENIIDVTKDFYKEDNAQRSPAYIGSFVKIVSGKDENKDKLFLWRTYGKDNDEEAAGACLIFDRKKFADSPSFLKIGGMYQLQSNAEIQAPEQEKEPYRICYKGETGKNGLPEKLTALSLALSEIKESFQSYEEKKEDLAQLVRELLDSIRFLFKADHYQQEQEVRVIPMSYQVGKEAPSNRQVDTDRMPPRFYLEMPEEVKPSEVILGPRTVRVHEWKQWLKEQGINKAEPSRIPFGKSV